ncbi:hypothetical protein [Citricoccus sp. GCM10030269]|uniref:hypothetical protein n=1 Tax=Citricoccus sp. GCM10030269 TaxID=3273388 RepID=UPI00360AF065
MGESSQVDGGQLVEVQQPDGGETGGDQEKQFSSTACVYDSAGGKGQMIGPTGTRRLRLLADQ